MEPVVEESLQSPRGVLVAFLRSAKLTGFLKMSTRQSDLGTKKGVSVGLLFFDCGIEKKNCMTLR